MDEAYYGIATIDWERLDELVYRSIGRLGGEKADLASFAASARRLLSASSWE